MNKKIILIPIGLLLFGLVSCSNAPKEITIVFTNDIHSYVANTTKEGDVALRLSKVGKYVDDLKAQGKNTLLIDVGDSIQGCVYGSYDNGATVIKLMNNAGYNLSVPGNHDFDYTVPTFLNLAKNTANFPFLSCNFVSLPDNKRIFDSTKIFTFDNLKVGFVGISTPETLTTSTPTFFQDDKGNWIYDFVGSQDKDLLYSITQEAVDSIRSQVDYVVAVGHLGIEQMSYENGFSSKNVIENTTGIDLFIDGHSHNVVEGDKIKNKENEDVTLVQAGQYLEQFGVATIKADKTISVEMNTDYASYQSETAKLENELIEDVDRLLGEKIANNGTEFYINNPDIANQRLIRAREMNVGDLVSDSFYWYLNDYKKLDCDVVIQNGGGIRTGLNQGEITYKDLYNVEPFGNVTCLIEATGQEIKDAIEMGVTVVDQWDEAHDCPAENGGFLQVAGLKYTVDCNIPSKVVTDEKGMFIKVDGDYRTTKVEIYDKDAKNYVDLDLSKTYRIGGINYLLRNSGNGLCMFADNKLIVDYLDTDFQVTVKYISNFTKDGEYPFISTSNSPLTEYTNYQLNYENPYGSSRISILNLPK